MIGIAEIRYVQPGNLPGNFPAKTACRTQPRPYNSVLRQAPAAMPFDSQSWIQFEGQTIDARFRLDRYLGPASHGGAIFETRHQGRPARIEITPADPASFDALRKRWQQAADLSHPALAAILASGATSLASQDCGYVVAQGGDEYLADALAERFLTPTETREMLLPVLDALRFLHARGFRHGDLTPANIMACGDQVKISSAAIVPGDDPASDSATIGTLLQEVLGTPEPAQMPSPFGEIAARCLHPDPSARWNVARIEATLLDSGSGRPGPAPTAAPLVRSRRFVWWILAAAGVAVVALVASWRAASHPIPAPPPARVARPAPEIVADKPSALPLPAARMKPAPAPRQRIVAASLDGVSREMPDIPQQALSTISGRVRINARVQVDSAGNVTQASLEPPPASKYFSVRVLAAARAWKFPASEAPRDFVLSFDLTHEEIRVTASESRPTP